MNDCHPLCYRTKPHDGPCSGLEDAPMKYTDVTMLNALLLLPREKLKERGPFQAMYDSLMLGKVVNLTKKQRKWVEGVFLAHQLDKKPMPSRKAPTVDKRKAVLDFGPLPKKPPGR